VRTSMSRAPLELYSRQYSRVMHRARACTYMNTLLVASMTLGSTFWMGSAERSYMTMRRVSATAIVASFCTTAKAMEAKCSTYTKSLRSPISLEHRVWRTLKPLHIHRRVNRFLDIRAVEVDRQSGIRKLQVCRISERV